MQLLIWYHVVPELIPPLKSVPEVVLACIGLGLFTSARIGQQVKAGINTLPKGQRYAGLAMGLTLARPTASCCCRWRCAWCCPRSRRSP